MEYVRHFVAITFRDDLSVGDQVEFGAVVHGQIVYKRMHPRRHLEVSMGYAIETRSEAAETMSRLKLGPPAEHTPARRRAR